MQKSQGWPFLFMSLEKLKLGLSGASMESSFLLSTKRSSSLLGDPCPGCSQPSVLSRTVTELESTGLIGMYHNCMKDKGTLCTETEKTRVLKGKSGNYNVIKSVLLDPYSKSSHTQFTFICTEMEPTTSPLQTLTQYFVRNTESAQIQCAFNAFI